MATACFQSLPVELRLEIWKLTFPERKIDLFANYGGEPIKSLFADVSPPAALHVCRDSREIALGYYTLEHWVVPRSNADHTDEEGVEERQGQRFYVNHELDTFCLLRSWSFEFMWDLGPLFRRFRKVAVEDCETVDVLLEVHARQKLQENGSGKQGRRPDSRFEGLDEITVMRSSPGPHPRVPRSLDNGCSALGGFQVEIFSNAEDLDPKMADRYRRDLYQARAIGNRAVQLIPQYNERHAGNSSEERSDDEELEQVRFPRIKWGWFELVDMRSESDLESGPDVSQSQGMTRYRRRQSISDRISKVKSACSRFSERVRKSRILYIGKMQLRRRLEGI